jgi:hypothetical protein
MQGCPVPEGDGSKRHRPARGEVEHLLALRTQEPVGKEPIAHARAWCKKIAEPPRRTDRVFRAESVESARGLVRCRQILRLE